MEGDCRRAAWGGRSNGRRRLVGPPRAGARRRQGAGPARPLPGRVGPEQARGRAAAPLHGREALVVHLALVERRPALSAARWPGPTSPRPHARAPRGRAVCDRQPGILRADFDRAGAPTARLLVDGRSPRPPLTVPRLGRWQHARGFSATTRPRPELEAHPAVGAQAPLGEVLACLDSRRGGRNSRSRSWPSTSAGTRPGTKSCSILRGNWIVPLLTQTLVRSAEDVKTIRHRPP